MTQTPCCTKDESHPPFHQSVTRLTTVKLDFDQIRTMICVSSGFRCSLLFLALFVAGQTLAKPGNSANSTPVSSTAAKHCNNVYNSFYAGTNKKIETVLQEMKKQLTQVQDDINILKGNKTSLKGNREFLVLLLGLQFRCVIIFITVTSTRREVGISGLGYFLSHLIVK